MTSIEPQTLAQRLAAARDESAALAREQVQELLTALARAACLADMIGAGGAEYPVGVPASARSIHEFVTRAMNNVANQLGR